MQPTGLKPDPIVDELARILASPGFIRNERLSGFLRFIVEQKLQGKTGELKEAVIGAEVFGRQPGYDTHSDPVVRTEASKLRSRLGEYYAGPGAIDPIQISVPKGAYIPEWKVVADTARPRRASWALTAAVTLGLGIAMVAAWRWARADPRPTVAVLPFLNLSSDPDNAYFSDGLADEITGLLASMEGLDVTARTSSFALRDTKLDAREIGAKLHATVLVEGSVQRSGDQLRVIVQLIRTVDGKHLWSKTYERQMREVLITEEEIAASVVNQLRLKLRGRRQYTENPEAFESYLRGRQALDRRSSDLAMRYFQQAASSDPSYAPAYAGIADTSFFAYFQQKASYSDAHERAKAAIEKALALDPQLSEAYTALGVIKIWDYALRDAESALQRAIELNPNNVQAHSSLASRVLAPLGRFEDALREARRALTLDPLSFGTSTSAQLAMLMSGRYQDIDQEARRILPFDPRRPDAYPWLALALSFRGRHAEAMETIQSGKRLAGSGKGLDWMLACVAVRAGHRDEALRILQQNLPPEFTAPPVNRRLFAIYACLGDKDHALEYAEKMYAEHEPEFAEFVSYPIAAWLRPDPAFAALRQRIGLPR